MITRRGLLTGAGAGFALGARPAGAVGLAAQLPFLSLVNGLVPQANAAVLFKNGINDGSFPSVLLNQPGSGMFAASEAHQLDMEMSPWGFTSVLLRSTTPPVGTHPLWGMNNIHGQTFKLEILPPGIYPIYDPNRGFPQTPINVPIGTQSLSLLVANTNRGVSLQFNRWLSIIGDIYDGSWHLIQSFLNPQGHNVGETPFEHEVLVDGYATTTYMMPGNNPRQPNPVFNIPYGGEDTGVPPTAWVGFDYPIFGGPPSLSWAQSNSYNGGMDHLFIENRFPVSYPQPQFMPMLMELSPTGSGLLFPGSPPPPIYLHGNATSTGFKHNQGFVTTTGGAGLSTSFEAARGYVTIESITIGGPPGVDD